MCGSCMIGSGGSDSWYLALSTETSPQPYLPSVMRKCATCGRDVWVDERTLEIADNSEIICDICFRKKIGGRSAY